MKTNVKGIIAGALLIASGATTATAAATVYEVDPAHSEVQFRIRHLVGKVTGHFTSFDGTIAFDPRDLAASRVSGSIAVESIDTRNAKRDEHLRGPDFFDSANHPRIAFETVRVVPLTETTGRMVGRLTMAGVTREVELDVEFTGSARDPWGNEKAGFSATTTVDRKDFGIEWNEQLDRGGMLLGDEVEITILAQGTAKTDGAAKEG